MSVKSLAKKAKSLVWFILKFGSLLAGIALLFKRREKLLTFLKSKSFLLTALYGLLLSLTAVAYRIIQALNWILQQGGK